MRAKTAGKLVDTWIYSYKGPIQGEEPLADEEDDRPAQLPLVRDQKVVVKVYIIKQTQETDTPPHTTKVVEFGIECDVPRFKLMGTDIELLRKEAFSRCDEHYATKWEKYYLVEVRRSYLGSEGDGTGMDFLYRDVHKGTGWDGSLLLKESDWRNGRAEKITAWPGEFRNRERGVIACIPATPQNKAALEEFTLRIDALRNRIAELLRPETILQTLNTLGQNSLLPAPDKQTAPTEQ